MRKSLILAGVLAIAAVAAPALAGAPPNYGGQFDSQSSMGFLAVFKEGGVAKVKHFEWDGLKCNGGGRFTGGLDRHKKFNVDEDRRFHGKAKVVGLDIPTTGKLRGRFSRHFALAHGTLKLTGACETKQTWHATEIAEK